jgi:hypothetical protein
MLLALFLLLVNIYLNNSHRAVVVISCNWSLIIPNVVSITTAAAIIAAVLTSGIKASWGLHR